MNHRIIARLDIKGPNLVKGIHLEGLRVLGKPEDFARHYYESGADELMYVDAVASGLNVKASVVVPLTVAGGIRSIEDINAMLRAGADKVSINTAAIKNPDFIKEASRKFGSSTIVVTIEAIKQKNGEYFAYTDNGRDFTGVEVISWAKKIESLGAGEIVITSVDNEGTGQGFDIELTKSVAEAVSIPVIAHGGAKNSKNIMEVIKTGKATSVAIASILHYTYIKDKEIINNDHYKAEGNVEFLKKNILFSKIEHCELKEIKSYLHKNGIDCRYDENSNN